MRKRSPGWLEWDLEISDHLLKRSVQRGFDEMDIRTMIADATGLEPSHRAGRFVVHARLGLDRWRIVVEPDADERKLIVVTAWRA